MCKWLGYGTQNEKSAADNLLCRREFSFTTGDDVYIRYLSYDGADALRKVRPKPEAHALLEAEIFDAKFLHESIESFLARFLHDLRETRSDVALR